MATLKTTWVKRLIDGVLTKTFAFAHVKSTYYNYTDGVTLKDKLDKMDASLLPVTTAGDGSAYTATITGITELYVGLKITIIPHVVSASTTPTLNLNNLGAIRIAMLTTANYTAVATPSLASWLSVGKPIELTYNGTYWIADMRRPSAAYLYGQVPIANGGTGASNAADALTNLGLTATAEELNYMDGVTSNVQTQLNGKTAVKMNGASTASSTANVYAPTSAGTKGYLLQSSGSGAPEWVEKLPIENGGTGANNAEDAKTNLGILTSDEIVNLYVWKKYAENPLYTETEVTKQAISIKNTGTNDYDIVYASEITAADGVVSLVDEQEITVTGTSDSSLADVKGKYVLWSNVVYFVPSTATFTTEVSSSGTYSVTHLRASKATKITANTTDPAPLNYVASKESGTYPTDGEHTDGYWYKYHKQLGE